MFGWLVGLGLLGGSICRVLLEVTRRLCTATAWRSSDGNGGTHAVVLRCALRTERLREPLQIALQRHPLAPA